MYGRLMAGGKQFVHCREAVLLSECPLSEVLLYSRTSLIRTSLGQTQVSLIRRCP